MTNRIIQNKAEGQPPDSNRLQVTVLRGENELTGNLIEIGYDSAKILVECGTSLGNDGNGLTELEREVLSRKHEAVFISHDHQDHDGLVDKVDKSIPVYMGQTALKLYKLFHPNVDTSNFRTYRANTVTQIHCANGCMICVKPYLCDHSATDSYMLEFYDDDTHVLYTGDFRSHGRKDFSKLLNSLPTNVDTLITEHTNGNYKGEIYDEETIERKLAEVICNTDKPVFVLCPMTAIDRIVSVYKATATNKRDLLIDIDQQTVLDTVGGKVPNAKTFSNVEVYYKGGKPRFQTFCDVRGKSVHIDSVAKRSNYTMIVSTSATGYLGKLAKLGADLQGATLVYSLWSGYKDNANMKKFLDKMQSLGMQIKTLHTSGHATQQAVDELTKHVVPKDTVFVHERSNEL